MNSIVERLRGLDTFGYQSQLACEAADLIEQQAERIKELEAERDAERDNCVNIIAAYQEERTALVRAVDTDYEQLYRETQEQLAALRRKIDEAPVVAWMSPGKERLEFSSPATVYGSHTIPLISKEDLQK